MTKTIKIGVMPGQLNEFVIEAGTTVKQALALAGLSADGYEVKADETVVTNFDTAVGNANVILLAKKVKGNAKTVKIGVMPGQLNEYILEDGATVEQALRTAGLSANGYEVKADETVVTNFSQPVGNANVILLAKKVKGNAKTVKIGVMPGQLNEYVIEDGATVEQALRLAGLSADGYEVKADETVISNFSTPVGNANVILLAKKVKGNAKTVKIGVMPGQLNEFILEDGVTVEQALQTAGLSASGYEVKLDETVVTNFSQSIGNANVILLAKKVKGN